MDDDGASHVSATAYATPVADKPTDVVFPVDELLLIVSVPLTDPLVVGLKSTFTVALCPGLSDAGTFELEIENPVPESVTELIATAEVPVEFNVTVWVDVVFRLTFPKAMVGESTLSVEMPGFSESAKVFATELTVAVSVAVVAEETAATLAVKLAEVEPAATVTDTGTVTETVLLASETASPPAGAVAVNVTVQLSLPAAE